MSNSIQLPGKNRSSSKTHNVSRRTLATDPLSCILVAVSENNGWEHPFSFVSIFLVCQVQHFFSNDPRLVIVVFPFFGSPLEGQGAPPADGQETPNLPTP